MFEESLVESTALLRTRNRAPVYISFATQAAILTAIVAIPLLHPEVIAIHTPMLKSITAPLPHKPPTPPPQPIHVQPTMATTAPAVPTAPQPAAPVVTQTFSSDAPQVDGALLPIMSGPATPNLPVAAAPAAQPAAPASPAPVVNAKPLPVSTGVSTGLLLGPIQPIYPQIAKMTHTQGTVVIQAIISKEGRITSAHVVSGSPMLAQAALDAVEHARYRPYLLNNQPTEVETTFSVNFRMNN